MSHPFEFIYKKEKVTHRRPYGFYIIKTYTYFSFLICEKRIVRTLRKS